MFHPTVFENVKVALENAIYDLDNVDRAVDIVDRRDLFDMAVMSRELSLLCRLAEVGEAVAELVLRASLKELAAEILEQTDEGMTCRLTLRFHLATDGAFDTCEIVERCLLGIWQTSQRPVQTIARVHGDEGGQCRHVAELDFGRGIGEEQMEELPELLEHVVLTLSELDRLLGNGGG